VFELLVLAAVVVGLVSALALASLVLKATGLIRFLPDRL